MSHTRIGHARWYDLKILLEAWQSMFTSSFSNETKDYDLVEVTREVLENLLDQQYSASMEAYYRNDSAAFHHYSASFTSLIKDLDDLLASNSRFMLGTWLEKAKSANIGECRTINTK